ncbi:RNA methyltransferase [Candidatus Sumerlaeota bacterium]|nr:RNA methyltransferase [Candidatus Sumerlaeota bacterium]
MGLDNIYIILHQPKGSLNVGYVARAMANTGFSHLRLSEPRCRIDSASFRSASAPAAHRILNKVRTYPSLQESVGDLHLVVGATARARHNRGLTSLEVATPQILNTASLNKVGIIFGAEECGLSNADLQLCDILLTIPVSERLPSYNVGHSVLLVCYTLMIFQHSHRELRQSESSKATNQQIKGLFDDVRETLLNIGYLNPQNPDRILQELRQIAGKAQLTEREVRILRGICRKVRTFVRKTSSTKKKK